MVRNSAQHQLRTPDDLLPSYGGRNGFDMAPTTAPITEQHHLAATYPPGQAYAYLFQPLEPPPTEPPPAYVRESSNAK
ncbi:hypothetical protein HDU86_003926 [Geranomyces michiganensis]|nr:hypothetical protein HDU86_003926 [Geranomyces michiganensis]